MSLKVLVADKMPDTYVEQMKEMGLEVDFSPKLGENDIPEAAKDADVIIVRSTKVNAAAIEGSEKLKFVIRAGAGYNNINCEAADKKGVAVANCPGKNSIAVAELAMGLIVSLDRRIPDNVSEFKKGVWNKNEYSKADGLYGKRLGLIGVGNIGKEVAKRALAFGIEVYGKDIVKIEGVDIKQFDNIEEMLPTFDIVSIHLPANAETKGMFNKKLFDLMKDGATFINTSRDAIVNEEDLIEAVKTKNLKVGVDVFANEPEGKTGEVSSPLQDLPNVYVTHHIGASTTQAQDAVSEEVITIIKGYLDNGSVKNTVNNPQ